jgi:lipoprotein-releasing system permease protein
MPFELFVALRYLVARRKQAFISLISVISTLGVAVGVAALIIAIALMTGLQGELRDRLLGAAAHIFVSRAAGPILAPDEDVARLRSVPHVIGASPVVYGKALLRTAQRDAYITLKGIDPKLEVSDVRKAMKQGSLDAILPRSADQPDGIVIGEALAKDLGAFVGDSVTVFTPEGTLSPMGIVPRTRRLKIVGLFTLGFFEADSSQGFVALDVAKRLAGREHPDYIELRVDDVYRAPEIAADIHTRFGTQYLAQDWTVMNGSLFSALWLEKMGLAIAIGLIVMVAALNIIASLVLMVMEKSRDIAILKTMGAPARSIMIIFMTQGLLIGAGGTLAGAVLGRGLAYVLDRYQLIHIPSDVYSVSYLPFRIQTADFLTVIASALFICFVATIYPSRQASRLDPAEALRYA